MFPSPSVKEFGIFVFGFRFYGKSLRRAKVDAGENVPKSETLYPKLFPWLIKDKGDSCPYSSRDTKNKGVTFIFLQASPRGDA